MAQNSPFSYNNPFPANYAFEITPSDSTDITSLHKGIWVGTSGDLVVQMWEDSGTVTLKGAVAGTLIPIRCKRVYSTGTTAADLVALL